MGDQRAIIVNEVNVDMGPFEAGLEIGHFDHNQIMYLITMGTFDAKDTEIEIAL